MHPLNSRQRIGQLFHVAAWSNKDKKREAEILDLIENHGIGGLIFFQGTPKRQAELTNQYQAAAATDMLLAAIQQAGLVSLTHTPSPLRVSKCQS